MIEVKDFLDALHTENIQFFTGVPDSLLKDVCAYINQNITSNNHVIATNEGSAIGLAIGHYLVTKNPALVYMQNSGLGNAINPLVSLADPMIYGIPMILMVGWRGEIDLNQKQINDEPQHRKQGFITLGQLDLLGVPYEIIDGNSDIKMLIKKLINISRKRSGPVALIVRKGTFSKYIENYPEIDLLPSRELLLSTLLAYIPKNLPIVSTTGMASRELFELRKFNQDGHFRDFLTVGGMGHALAIASGIALANFHRKVVCLDGDGALLMHMGALALSSKCENLIHIVLNNGAHDSVGGQPTRALEISLSKIAKGSGYSLVKSVNKIENISKVFNQILSHEGSVFLEIMCKRGSRKDLGRPNRSPLENRDELMVFLRS